MAEVTLRLVVDPKTGKREVVIDYAGDADALPFEHEEQHRQAVEKVVQGGLARSRRDEGVPAEAAPASSAPVAREAVKREG